MGEEVEASPFWAPLLWKRSHMLLGTFGVAGALLFIWELSYSYIFEANVYFFIIGFKLLQVVIDIVLARLMRENLMMAPLMIVIEITEIMITMGASSLVDFITSFGVESCVMVAERLYLDPGLKKMVTYFPKWRLQLKKKFQKRRRMTRVQRQRQEAEWKRINEEIAMENEGVEPLLDSYFVYSLEITALILTPYINIFLFLFGKTTEIPVRYGIKETEMLFYILFAVVMVPFSVIVDVFLLNSQELAHGWKLYDYVHYQAYRFSVREHRWMLDSDTLDESIAEPLQSVDMLCFSDQYYFIMTIHSWGMLFPMFGTTAMLRVDYALFSDPIAIAIFFLMYVVVRVMKWVSIRIGLMFRLWKRKGLEGTLDDDIAAKLAIGDGANADLEQERLELQAMNSERFRHRFLERSRPWVLQHLTELLTPRTLKMPGADGRENIEYIRDTYNDLMNLGVGKTRPGDNSDISSDEGDEDQAMRRNWSKAPLSQSSAAIARYWLQKARKRRVLFKLVSGFIRNATLDTCQLCGRTETSGAIMRADLALDGKADPRALDK